MHFALRSEFRPLFLFGSSSFHLFHTRTEETLLILMGLFGCGFGPFGGLCGLFAAFLVAASCFFTHQYAVFPILL